eukprot:6214232-Pleurochrysis_carterae.AAC.3
MASCGHGASGPSGNETWNARTQAMKRLGKGAGVVAYLSRSRAEERREGKRRERESEGWRKMEAEQ